MRGNLPCSEIEKLTELSSQIFIIFGVLATLRRQFGLFVPAVWKERWAQGNNCLI